jgi:hypothetical protein
MSYGGPDDYDLPADPGADADASDPLEAGVVPESSVAEESFEPLPPPEPDPAVVADLRAVAEIERDLQGVDAALRRLDDGTYGTCVACGRPIEAATLEANPIEDHCAHCDPAQGRLTGL